ncbi:hypothetical protein RclHR1_00770016 [Rhizophagus clarus]|uniref:Uncharacterized protein n=1 Tax=Rhizophagus clarus TaxID=94130 RepID=A0A2Z6S4G2_9GLOM|nr:hypothetical protein RclHR1_00770016 [Rhizophagus clarus]
MMKNRTLVTESKEHKQFIENMRDDNYNKTLKYQILTSTEHLKFWKQELMRKNKGIATCVIERNYLRAFDQKTSLGR